MSDNNMGDFGGIDSSILDFNDEPDMNIKIKPNYYIHTALLMAQRTLMISVLKSSVTDGIISYMVFVEHIEVLCKAAGYLGEEYDGKVKEYTTTEEYKNIERKDIQMAKLSNKKLEILMSEIFGRSPITSSLSDTK